jgi:biopolymer transport protein ExbD
MSKRSRQYSLGTLSELNVTPLLDLAFVLLIIFMITAPFLAESADLIIPSSKASRDAIDPAQVYTVSLDRNHKLEIDGQAVEHESLADQIRTLVSEHKEMAVIVKAHHLLPIQDVVGIMDILREAGVAHTSIVTKPEGE